MKNQTNRAGKHAGITHMPTQSEMAAKSAPESPVHELLDSVAFNATAAFLEKVRAKAARLSRQEQIVLAGLLDRAAASLRNGNIDAANPARNYAAMCEESLGQQLAGMTAAERRALAEKFQRWAFQLFASADLIERLESGKIKDADEILFPNETVQKILHGKPRSHGLEVAAELEVMAAEIRRCVGVKPRPAASAVITSDTN